MSEIIKKLDEILIEIKALSISQKLLVESLQPHREYRGEKRGDRSSDVIPAPPGVKSVYAGDSKPRELEVKEEVVQDFQNVTIMMETDKAYLVVKNGYQMWVAKSNLQEDYELGNNVDLLLTEKAEKWLPKKSWDKYQPQKGGK